MLRRRMLLLCAVLLAAGLAACGVDEGAGGLERQAIQAIVADYFSRDANVPQYDVNVDEVDDGWARVTATPAGVEAEPIVFFLYRDPAEEAPETAWDIVLGPQTIFTDEELDEAGIPEDIRE